MSDPRITPDPALITQSIAAQIIVPVTDLCRRADGPRDRQLIYGDTVTVLSGAGGWDYVQSDKDGYCGHVTVDAIGGQLPATHRVNAAATHAYASADLKSPETTSLTCGSTVQVISTTDDYAETPLGHIPRQHLGPMDEYAVDPVDIADLFLHTPYLWGGNSRWGIDCSGLIQAALLACNIPCPGDSDMQQSLGTKATGGYQRGDLLFWKGHVAMVRDAETMIHATAASMSTMIEPIEAAIKRIAAAGEGPVIAHRRIL